MVIPDEAVYTFGGGIIGVLGWIGKSVASAAKELKLLSLIIRTCPGCQKTVENFDNAQEHSEI
jgi:hypothetical protein